MPFNYLCFVFIAIKLLKQYLMVIDPFEVTPYSNKKICEKEPIAMDFIAAPQNNCFCWNKSLLTQLWVYCHEILIATNLLSCSTTLFWGQITFCLRIQFNKRSNSNKHHKSTNTNNRTRNRPNLRGKPSNVEGKNHRTNPINSL